MRPRARQLLVDKGFDEKFGARPLRRIFQREIEDPLSHEILKGRFGPGATIVVDVRDGRVVFRAKRVRAAKKTQEPASVAG